MSVHDAAFSVITSSSTTTTTTATDSTASTTTTATATTVTASNIPEKAKINYNIAPNETISITATTTTRKTSKTVIVRNGTMANAGARNEIKLTSYQQEEGYIQKHDKSIRTS